MLKLAFLLVLITSVGIAYAGTVTLTGTCTQQLNQNALSFSLHNSGNDSAFDVVVVPVMGSLRGAAYESNSLGPGRTFNFTEPIVQHANGSYAYYFTTSYEQGSSSFDAVFPCMARFGNNANGDIGLGYSVSQDGMNYTVYVSVQNNGSADITDNVSLMLPQSFVYVSQPFELVNASAHGTAGASFTVRSSAAGSYSGAAVSNYQVNGTNIASMISIVLAPEGTAQGPVSGVSVLSLFELSSIIIIVMLLLLIARAIARKGPEWMRNRVKGSS